MKFRFCALVLFAILAIYQVTPRRLHSRKLHSRVHATTRKDFENPAGNFVFKAIMAFMSLDEDKLITCISGIADKKLITDPRTPDEVKKDEAERKENFSVIGTLLDTAATVISFICNWKEKLASFIADLFADARRLRRNRLFFQGKSMRFMWCLTCWIKDKYKAFTSAVVNVGKQVYKVGATVLSTVGDAMKNGLNSILSFVSWCVTSLTNLYNKYARPLLAKLKTLGSCASVGINVGLTIKSLIENIPELASPAAVLVIIKNIICAVEDVIAAAKAFYQAWNEPQTNIKWGKYGTAVGLIAKILTGVKAQRRFRFIEKKHKNKH